MERKDETLGVLVTGKKGESSGSAFEFHWVAAGGDRRREASHSIVGEDDCLQFTQLLLSHFWSSFLSMPNSTFLFGVCTLQLH